MAHETNYSACNLFATLFAGLMAHSVSTACGAEWQIELTDPPPVPTPVIAEPLHYELRFTRGLRGGCYLVISQTDAAGFGSPQTAAAEREAAAALLALLEEVVAALPHVLAESHGEVSIEAAIAEAPDFEAPHAIALEAKGAGGKSAVLLLHFDGALISCLAERMSADGKHASQGSAKANLDLVMDVELNCTLRFGQRQLSLREILDLASGSVVELDRQVDEPVELILDGKVIARGEAVIIDGNYGLRVTQVVQPVPY